MYVRRSIYRGKKTKASDGGENYAYNQTFNETL